MTVKGFIAELESHREIELHINEMKLFLQPDWEDEKQSVYALYDCTTNESILLFKGEIASVLSFKVDDKYSLANDWNSFSIDFVL